MNILMEQVLPQPAQTISLGGPQVQFQLDRSSLINKLYIVVEGVVGTAVNALSAAGAMAVIGAVNIQGNKNVGGNYNPVQNMDGASLAAFMQSKYGEAPKIVNSTLQTGRFTAWIPVIFEEPAFGDILAWTNALPAMLMSTLTVTITPGALADVDAGTGALVFSSLSCYVVQHQADVMTIPRWKSANPQDGYIFTAPGSTFPIAIPFTDMTLSKNVYSSGVDYATGIKQLQEPAGGFYTDLNYLAYASATSRQLDATAVPGAPISNAAGAYVQLYTLGRTVLRSQTYAELRGVLHDRCVDAELEGLIGWAFSRSGRYALLDTELASNTQGSLQVDLPLITSTNGKVTRISKIINDPLRVIVGPKNPIV